ncbi:MAG: exo-alpha-sialidase [Verrucomicrobiota bacterium]
MNHLAAAHQAYLGSPSIAERADGTYVVSHDIFGPGSTRDKTLIFQSHDQGKKWKQIAEVNGQWWSTLFVHREKLYLIGTTRENGFAAIRRSDDGGKNWSEPKDENSGLLFSDGRYHCAPVPVILHDGRIWRAMEDAMGGGGWGKHFHAFMMSAPEDSDLLKKGSWTFSDRIGRDMNWLNGEFEGWLEGNAVVLPNGEMADILRVASPRHPERAAIIRISADGKRAVFDPTKDFVEFPGGAKKFTIRLDPKSQRYYSLANPVPENFRETPPDKTRNTLALISSPDCREWKVERILYQNPDTRTHGYQYVDWLFEGDDIISVIRVAHDDDSGGAHNQHDSNFITFLRVKNFRSLGK